DADVVDDLLRGTRLAGDLDHHLQTEVAQFVQEGRQVRLLQQRDRVRRRVEGAARLFAALGEGPAGAAGAVDGTVALALRHAPIQHRPLLRADAPLQDHLALVGARVDAVDADDRGDVPVSVDPDPDLAAGTLAGEPVLRLQTGGTLAAGVV